MRVVHDLEGQHRQRIAVERPAHGRLAGLDVDRLEGLAVGRRGQVVDHGIEQRLHALVLEGRAAQHRIEDALDGRLADQPLQRIDVGLLAVEVGAPWRRRPSRRRPRSSRRGTRRPCPRGRRGSPPRGTWSPCRRRPRRSPSSCRRSTTPLKLASAADRDLQRHRPGAQLLLDVVDAHVEVGAGLIHLVGEDDARHAVLVALAPDRLGLRLDALVAVEHAHGAVEHAQASAPPRW